VSSTGISGYPGEIIPLTAMVSPEDCDFESCDWSVAGDVCKVESDGFNAAVELLSPGKGTIMFVLNQIVGIKRIVKEIPVQVKAPVKEISIKIDGVAVNPEKSLVDVTGAVYTVTAIPNSDAADKRLIWEISNPEAVRLEVSGNDAILTFKKQGIAYLKITAADGRGASVTIGIGVKESGQPDPVIPAPETPEEPEDIKVEQLRLAITKHAGYPGDKLTLIVEVLPKNATDQTVLWTTSHSEIASVSDAGEINLLKEGNAVVTGTAADGSGVSVTCAIQVKSRPTSIDGIDNPNGKVSVEESSVIVQGINDGDTVSLYSASGILIDRKRCVGDAVSFTVGAHGIYIVVTPAASFKIRY
ncbi:MAG: Ig-like domain-containing protein, partial [Paramuribaculum sp.]|nr:Ig-like domain-containing protein [Paramuribaculum sp.]